uniref:Ovule protein n=1 Tax=Heterorhabditis bacteriophora TaxID=37862 RepID=A0A1I7WLH0_HETBA
MKDYRMFWKQFWEMLEKYGIPLLATTILSGLTLGYLLHYLKNVLPLKKQHLQNEGEFEEQISAEEQEDKDSAAKSGREQKQIGIVKGMINSEVFSTIRRKPIYEEKKNGPEGLIKDTDCRPLLVSEESNKEEHDCKTENISQGTTDESDDDGVVVVENSSGRKKSESLGLVSSKVKLQYWNISYFHYKLFLIGF